MKKSVALFSGFLAMLTLTTTAMANTTSPTSSVKVWVAKDITRQENYTVKYTYYDSGHNVLSKQSIVPPTGFLVEFLQVPLSQAIRDNEPFVPVQAGESSSELSAQLERLHEQLFTKLHPHGVSEDRPVAPKGASDPTASGSFSNPNTGQQWTYAITYTDETNGSVNVSYYTCDAYYPNWYLNYFSWENDIDNVYEAVTTGYETPLSWQGTSGYQFTTCTEEGNTAYSGWTTLY